MLYLVHEAPEEEQEQLPVVMEMLQAAKCGKKDDEYESPLDMLFSRLEMRDPESIALQTIPGLQNGRGQDSQKASS